MLNVGVEEVNTNFRKDRVLKKTPLPILNFKFYLIITTNLLDNKTKKS